MFETRSLKQHILVIATWLHILSPPFPKTFIQSHGAWTAIEICIGRPGLTSFCASEEGTSTSLY